MFPSFPSNPGITIVLGMHRSGTSLCSHLLSLLGLDMADTVSPHASNPKGHWERSEIVAFHDRILRHFDQDYHSPRHAEPLPSGWWAWPEIRAIRDEITAWIRPRLAATRRFGFKDPRTCRLLPMWREILADLDVSARFVVCLRDPAAVADSLRQRDQTTPDDGALRWLVYNTDLVDGLGGSDAVLLPYEAWFADPTANLARLAQVVPGLDPGDPLVRDLVDGVVDAALCHSAGSMAGSVPPLVRGFHRMMMDCVPHGRFGDAVRQTARTFAASAAFLRIPRARPEADRAAAPAEPEASRGLVPPEGQANWDAAASLVAVLAEKDELKTELAALRQRLDAAEQAAGAATELDALRAELEEALDAARVAEAGLAAARETERQVRWDAAAALAAELAEKDRLTADLAAARAAAAQPVPEPVQTAPAAEVPSGGPLDASIPMASPAGYESTAFSCVLDKDPALAAQCDIWLDCLLRLRDVPASHVFIHATAGSDPDLLRRAESLGVNVVPIEPLDPRGPHCNKICQLETFERGRFERVVLMDCDTAWIGPLELPRTVSRPAIQAKVVDRANPPERILTALFAAAGLGEPDWVAVSCPAPDGDRRTDRNNCNGGLYILDRAALPGLRPLWRKWALWCLDQGDILGRHVRNADQLGFALALRELGVAVTPLPVEWNYPTHLPGEELPDVAPLILHYHRELTEDGGLKEIGVPQPDAAIRVLNEQLAAFRRARVLSSVFGDLRQPVEA